MSEHYAEIDTRLYDVIYRAGMHGLTVLEIMVQTGYSEGEVRAALARLDGPQGGDKRVMPVALTKGEQDRYASYASTDDEREACQRVFGNPEAREMWRKLGRFFAPDDPRFRA